MKKLGCAVLSVVVLVLTGQGAMAEGDAAEGKRLFRICKECHRLRDDTGKRKKDGPHLESLLGRKAASVEGFAYSAAMRRSGIIWDAETLDRFVAAPKAVAPGTKMDFEGLPDKRDRLDLIAYLKKATKTKP